VKARNRDKTKMYGQALRALLVPDGSEVRRVRHLMAERGVCSGVVVGSWPELLVGRSAPTIVLRRINFQLKRSRKNWTLVPLQNRGVLDILRLLGYCQVDKSQHLMHMIMQMKTRPRQVSRINH